MEMAGQESREVTLTRIIDAPRDLVFRAWTEAQHLAEWWGPEGFTAPKVESDARAGGSFKIVMRGPDGTESEVEGTYKEFDPPNRLVTQMRGLASDGTPLLDANATVTLTDHGGKTELSIHQRATALLPEAIAMLGGMEVGLLQSLRRLDDVVTGTVGRQIVLGRMLEAPRDRVFEAFTSEEQLSHWWGPTGFTLTTHEISVRPGGTWRFTMHGPDGVDYPNVIVYDEVSPPELISYEHSGGPDSTDPHFRVAASFDEFMGNTILTMRKVFESAADRDMVVEKHNAIEGGNQTLDRLAEHVKG
jgi:uncharacterized protein YndB with AHSA1/START domain